MVSGAFTRRVREQTKRAEVYLHKPTKRRLVVILEAGGAVELQGIDGRSTYAKREDLNNYDIYERLS
jgi:hypothetical protein